MSSDHLILLILAACAVSVTLHFRRRRAPLSPGPRGLPIVGNAFQVDPLRLYPKMKEWADEYGEVFSLRFGMQTLIVVNTAEAAHELLVARGAKHSSRPASRVVQNIMSAGQCTALLPYGNELKTVLRSFRDAIGPTQMKGIRETQELESRTLIHDLTCHGEQSITEPQARGEHVPDDHWFFWLDTLISIMLNIVYGRRLRDGKLTQNVFEVTDNFVRVTQPGRYLVDAFPILDMLPDWAAPWRAAARAMHDWETELWGRLLATAQTSPHTTGYVACYLRQRANAGFAKAPGRGLVNNTNTWMRDEFVAYSAGTLLEAGADSIFGAVQIAVLLFLTHPRVLEKARTELDAIVGPSRLPQFTDGEQLPYLHACVKEVLRRRPPAPLGMPHAAMEDDMYKGFLIPKGAIVIGNIWAIHMDPRRFPDPLEFRPERFLDPSNPTNIQAFGWGRRECPGRAIAENSLFITLSRIIWALDFHAPILPDPADESPEGPWSDGLASLPRLYGVAFKPREGRRGVIQAAYEAAQTEWEGLGLETDRR